MFVAQHFQLPGAPYPRHLVPAVDAFICALELGMGWGMVHDQQLAAHGKPHALVEVVPGASVDIALYWQHWAREPAPAQQLTAAVRQAAREHLVPPAA
jgi:LysR family transcriptional regulator (chromosome initiation inhibitor)